MSFYNQVKALLLLFFVGFFISEVNGQTINKNEIDEFTGNQVIQSSHEQIDHEGFTGRSLVSAFYNEGDYIMVITVRSNDSWQLLSADKAYFLIDGEREQYTLHRVESDTDGTGVTEVHAVILSESEFEKFGSADEIKFRADGNVYTLSPEAINTFNLVLETLEEG